MTSGAAERQQQTAEKQQQATERQQKQQTEVMERQRPPTTAQALVPQTAGVSLTTEAGITRIADSVVAKIAGLAARDIPGVHSMGHSTSMTRRMGQLRSLVGGGEPTSAMQGVSVEVGQQEAAVDLNIVTWYGQSIVEIAEAVRRNVIGQVEGATGLRVVEVNISVDDIHVEAEEPERVR